MPAPPVAGLVGHQRTTETRYGRAAVENLGAILRGSRMRGATMFAILRCDQAWSVAGAATDACRPFLKGPHEQQCVRPGQQTAQRVDIRELVGFSWIRPIAARHCPLKLVFKVA